MGLPEAPVRLEGMEDSMRTVWILAAWFTAALLLAGCAPSKVEMDRGKAFDSAKYNQILNADAGKNLAPVEGMDGKAANAAVDKYRKTYEKPAPAQTFNFSVGSGSSGGSGN
jgi:hypothetical protein